MACTAAVALRKQTKRVGAWAWAWSVDVGHQKVKELLFNSRCLEQKEQTQTKQKPDNGQTRSKQIKIHQDGEQCPSSRHSPEQHPLVPPHRLLQRSLQASVPPPTPTSGGPAHPRNPQHAPPRAGDHCAAAAAAAVALTAHGLDIAKRTTYKKRGRDGGRRDN